MKTKNKYILIISILIILVILAILVIELYAHKPIVEEFDSEVVSIDAVYSNCKIVIPVKMVKGFRSDCIASFNSDKSINEIAEAFKSYDKEPLTKKVTVINGNVLLELLDNEKVMGRAFLVKNIDGEKYKYSLKIMSLENYHLPIHLLGTKTENGYKITASIEEVKKFYADRQIYNIKDIDNGFILTLIDKNIKTDKVTVTIKIINNELIIK